MKVYREWKICGDTEWLRACGPNVSAIAFAWHPDNEDRWDPDKTGVLWGRQHHTLDMELFGPNAWLTGFYLGALKAAAEMAEHWTNQNRRQSIESSLPRVRHGRTSTSSMASTIINWLI